MGSDCEKESVSDNDSGDPVMLSYITIFNIIELVLGDTKIPFVLKKRSAGNELCIRKGD